MGLGFKVAKATRWGENNSVESDKDESKYFSKVARVKMLGKNRLKCVIIGISFYCLIPCNNQRLSTIKFGRSTTH